jgi:hypothetical protein
MPTRKILRITPEYLTASLDKAERLGYRKGLAAGKALARKAQQNGNAERQRRFRARAKAAARKK